MQHRMRHRPWPRTCHVAFSQLRICVCASPNPSRRPQAAYIKMDTLDWSLRFSSLILSQKANPLPKKVFCDSVPLKSYHNPFTLAKGMTWIEHGDPISRREKWGFVFDISMSFWYCNFLEIGDYGKESATSPAGPEPQHIVHSATRIGARRTESFLDLCPPHSYIRTSPVTFLALSWHLFS